MIKKHITKNEYYSQDGKIWVRNFTKKSVKPLDLNNLINPSELSILLNNEVVNNDSINHQPFYTSNSTHEKIIIVSSGYGFLENQHLLEEIPRDVAIIGVNYTLKQWDCKRQMNYYVVNNPYEECLDFMPDPGQFKTEPKFIASTRTNCNFLKEYPGIIYTYSPSNNKFYSGIKTETDFYVDDYRNPICAAIAIANRFKAKKLSLLFCDEMYEKEKPGSVKVQNEMWMYPQQITANKVIDANLYWLKRSKVDIVYHPKGVEYENAEYIEKEAIVNFYKN